MAHVGSRSQSALEYMMTYGWAIIIIVIVAGTLYSLGIFSPSNSASTTITGFSGLGSVQAECIGNQGVSIQVGDSLGYPLQILNLSVTSSGTTTTLQVQQTINPNQNAIFYVPNVCPSSGSKYSLSVNVYYQEPGQSFPGPYSSKGTVQGTPSTQPLSSSPTIATIIPITITNTQNTSTSSPFQQLVQLPSGVYTGYANLSGLHSFQNVEFFYSNGTIIPSWLENYTNTHATWWLKMVSMAALSSITVYMGFASVSSNLFNVLNVGEAPQISGTWGQYDDGAKVFTLYDNFTGPSLNSQWNSGDCHLGGTITVNHGLTISTNSTANYCAIYLTSSSISFPASVYSDAVSFNAVDWPGIAITTSGTDTGAGLHTGGISHGGAGSAGLQTGQKGPGFTKGVMGVTWLNNNTEETWRNDTSTIVNVKYFNVTPATQNVGLGLGEANSAPSTTVTFAYARIQAAPPNGVMPSVFAGQPSSITLPANVQIYTPLTIYNNENGSVSSFQQMVTAPSSVYSSYANLSGLHSFQNVEFFYANGTIIPSWLENWTSSQALWWIKLPFIAPYTSSTVYIGFVPKTTNLLNTANIGEAPQLSSTYAQYDDGPNIFLGYGAFQGSSLPSGWTLAGNGTFKGGASGIKLDFAQNSGGSAVFNVPSYPSTGIIIEGSYYELCVSDDMSQFVLNNTATFSAWSWSASANTWGDMGAYDFYSGGTPAIYTFTKSTGGSNVQSGTTGSLTSNTYSYSQTIVAKGSITMNYAHSSSAFSTPIYSGLTQEVLFTGSVTIPISGNIGAYGGDGGGATPNIGVLWQRARAYPPLGVMPSVSFGSVQ